MFIETSRRRSPSTASLRDLRAQRRDLGLGQVLDLGLGLDARASQTLGAWERPMP